MIRGMAIALLAAGSAIAAFCVWLAVRIVNRRERWAKRTLAAVIALPALYVASIGPAQWFSEYCTVYKQNPLDSGFYAPIKWGWNYGPPVIGDAIYWYLGLWL